MNRSFLQAAAAGVLPVTLALLLAGCAGDLPLTRQESTGLTLYAAEEDSVEAAKRAAGSLPLIADRLQIPVPSNDLAVYLLPSGAALRRYLKKYCPEQASKAAACFTSPEGYVIAVAPDSVDGDVAALLRHEITHYLLSSRYYDFPPWIDEGLAQYFERENFDSPLDSGELTLMRRDGSGLSAEGIEAILAVPPGGELTGRQYRETKALVHFLMEDSAHGPEEVACYLGQVRSDGRHLAHLQRCFRLSAAELADGARSWFSRPG